MEEKIKDILEYHKREKINLETATKLLLNLHILNLHIVSDSVCSNCDGYGYTLDENGRRKEHCDKC